MKKPGLFFTGLVVIEILNTVGLNAQESSSDSNFDVNTDFYTSYIWRGSKLSQGPSLQPCVKIEQGGLTVGVWGAFDASGYAEADPYVSYSFKKGYSIGLTDYYDPRLEVFDVSESTGNHALEINTGFTKGAFSLSANYIVNKAGGVASEGGDIYFEAGYATEKFNVFVGAGNGWHTSEGDFDICNIGLGTSKVIEITDRFSVPVTGLVVLNPDKEQLFVVAGFSF